MKKSELKQIIRNSIKEVYGRKPLKEQQIGMSTGEYLANSTCADKFYLGLQTVFSAIDVMYGQGYYNTPASSYIYSRLANATTLSPSVAAAEGYCFFSTDQGDVTAFGEPQDTDLEAMDVTYYWVPRDNSNALRIQRPYLVGSPQPGNNDDYILHQEEGLTIQWNGSTGISCGPSWQACLNSQLPITVNGNDINPSEYQGMGPQEFRDWMMSFNQVQGSWFGNYGIYVFNPDICEGCEGADKTVDPGTEADRIDDPEGDLMVPYGDVKPPKVPGPTSPVGGNPDCDLFDEVPDGCSTFCYDEGLYCGFNWTGNLQGLSNIQNLCDNCPQCDSTLIPDCGEGIDCAGFALLDQSFQDAICSDCLEGINLSGNCQCCPQTQSSPPVDIKKKPMRENLSELLKNKLQRLANIIK